MSVPDETLTVLLAEIQQIVTAGTLLVGRQSPTEFPTALRTGESEEKIRTTTPPSWPGRYMGGGAWWRHEKTHPDYTVTEEPPPQV